MSTTTPPFERRYSIAEIMELTSLSRSSIKNAMAAREFEFEKLGDARNAPVRVRESVLREWWARKVTATFKQAEALSS